MSFKNIESLCSCLVQLKLLDPAKRDECLAELDPSKSQLKDFLNVLSKKNFLTSYQLTRLNKGETTGLVLGNYKLLYQNASGSFARVYRAASLDQGQMVGLKVLRQRWAKDSLVVNLFHREAQLCRNLLHKNIVPIYDVGSEENFHFFTMEFVEGGNLRDFINIRKKLRVSEATRLVLDMTEGLQYALSHGVTHRDLKMTNVLISSQGVAKLVDFGLAGSSEHGDSHQALEYLTIEKWGKVPANDPRSDLYFLGAIYYELLTGTAPYERTRNRMERKQITRYSNVRPIRSLNPSLPICVINIVDRLMKLDPNQRYQSPSEVIADLKKCLEDLGEDQEIDFSEEQRSGDKASNVSMEPTVLCVEHRIKQQDLLRSYLSKAGYRVLMYANFDRALNRIQTSPPDCVLLMGEALGGKLVDAFQKTTRLTKKLSILTIAILSQSQSQLQENLSLSELCKILVQPITLKELRNEIDKTIKESQENSDEFEQP